MCIYYLNDQLYKKGHIMYTKTTAMANSSLFEQLSTIQDVKKKPRNRMMTIQKNYSDTFFQFKKPVTLTANNGIALLVVTADPHDPSSYEEYILQGSITLESNVYFNTLTVTDQCSIFLEPQLSDEPILISVAQQFKVKNNQPLIQIESIFSIVYQVKTAPFALTHQNRDYCELIIVDQGEINHQINGNELILGQHECILLFPGEDYSQTVHKEGVTTYLTIMFNAKGLEDEMSQKIYHLTSKHSSLVDRMVKLSTNPTSYYTSDEIFLSFKNLLMSLIQGQADTIEEPTTSMRENYENELFQAIADYLHQNVEEQNQVNDLVDHFALSRSTLQMLFKKHANTSPKAYINQLRLQRSKVLIRESKMSLSEIASELGYGSIQYFSRAFSREFGMSPSSYAKSLIK